MEIILKSPLAGAVLKEYPNGDILQLYGENYRAYSVKRMKDYDGNLMTMQGHGGIDMYLPKPEDILSAHDGYVYDMRDNDSGSGRYIRIRSNRTGDYYMTIYGHLSSISVKVGQLVKTGDKIGTIGNSGFSLLSQEVSIKSVQYWGKAPANYGVHLHFGLRIYINGRTDITNGYFGCVDPMRYLITKNMIENCIVHNTAVSYDKNPDQWIATNNYHRKKWNFKSSLGFYAGYHYEIAKDGTVRQARNDNEHGAHTIGYNHNSIGIVLDGDFENEKPTTEQLASLKKLVTRLNKLYNFKKIGGHRDFDRRTCPGKYMTDTMINNLTKNDMRYVKTISGSQEYLLDDNLMIKLNIGDVPEREFLQKRGLKGLPISMSDDELAKYQSYPLVRKDSLKKSIGELRDKLGL